MGSLKAEMKKYFQTEDLYTVMNVNKDASEDIITRAYRKVALQVHPDRAPLDEKELATAKFQVVSKIYSILSDKEKRKIYDETGVVDDDLSSKNMSDWNQYFRSIFKKIEVEDIEAFEREYVGSEEEKEDLLKFYERFKGDMNLIVEHLFFYKFEREADYRAIVADAVKRKEVKDYKVFSKESADSVKRRQKKFQREAKAAERESKKRGQGGGDAADLVKMIQANQEKRQVGMSQVVDKLEQKYGKKVKRNTKDDDSSDGEWEGLSGDDCDKPDTSDDEGKKRASAKKPKATAAPKRRKN